MQLSSDLETEREKSSTLGEFVVAPLWSRAVPHPPPSPPLSLSADMSSAGDASNLSFEMSEADL